MSPILSRLWSSVLGRAALVLACGLSVACGSDHSAPSAPAGGSSSAGSDNSGGGVAGGGASGTGGGAGSASGGSSGAAADSLAQKYSGIFPIGAAVSAWHLDNEADILAKDFNHLTC